MNNQIQEPIIELAKETQDFITNLYAFTFLPIFYYQNNRLAFCIPTTAIDYEPPLMYRNAFFAFPHKVSYQMTDFGALYGYIKDVPRNGYYIIGPCTSVPYEASVLFSMRREFNVPEIASINFNDFIKEIPRKTLADFLAQLRFIGYCCNAEAETPHDLMVEDIQEENAHLEHNFIEMHIHDKEDMRENNSLEIEKKLLSYVETGDVENLKNFMYSAFNIDVGTMANTSLRNSKNSMIVSTALTCRAAIRGGLSSDLAFHLSDSYIQQFEVSNSLDSIQNLSRKMILDYTERVAQTRSNLHGDPILQKAIRFVQHNTNQHITVSDVADYVGLSRGYLSTFFKESLGFELSSFIRRCKLEEAKELLRYSDRSISEISSYLCFSSQSHFQNSFKKQYKITPQQYRHGVEK